LIPIFNKESRQHGDVFPASCCPLSSAFEAATRAYRHLANGSVRKRDRQTDGRVAALLYVSYRRTEA